VTIALAATPTCSRDTNTPTFSLNIGPAKTGPAGPLAPALPFQDNFGSVQVRKQSKYQELVEEAEANGFDAVLITIEVGS